MGFQLLQGLLIVYMVYKLNELNVKIDSLWGIIRKKDLSIIQLLSELKDLRSFEISKSVPVPENGVSPYLQPSWRKTLYYASIGCRCIKCSYLWSVLSGKI
jgi:hypothetical protein